MPLSDEEVPPGDEEVPPAEDAGADPPDPAQAVIVSRSNDTQNNRGDDSDMLPALRAPSRRTADHTVALPPLSKRWVTNPE